MHGVTARVFRLPRLAYIVVGFVAVGTVPLALTATGDRTGTAILGPRLLFFAIPILAAVFIARTATVVDARGITVRAVFGHRTLPWAEVRGLSVTGRNIYVVADDGAIRLPCVRIADLAAVSAASDGHLPEVEEATPKYAPQAHRRR